MLSAQIENRKSLIKKRSEYNAESFCFGLMIFSFTFQFVTIIYQLFGGLSVIFTAAEIVLWGIGWLWISIEKKKFEKHIGIILPCILLFGMLCLKILIANGLDDSYYSPTKSLYQIFSLLYTLMLGCCVMQLSDKYKYLLLKYIYIMFILTVLPSYIYVLDFPDAIRNQVSKYGIIDFQYIYSVIPFIGLTISALRRGNIRRGMRALMSIMVIVNSGIILLSNFATAMIILLFTILIALISPKRISIRRIIIVALLVILFIFLLREQIAALLFKLADISFFGTVMKHRLQDIARFLQGVSVGYSFTARIKLMSYSFESFLKSPIFGASFGGTGFGTFGFHETWVTVLAYSGILGFVAIVLSIALFLRYVKKNSRSLYFHKLFLLMLLVYLLLSVLNPMMTKSPLMMCWTIMPMLGIFFKSKGGKRASLKSVRKVKYE